MGTKPPPNLVVTTVHLADKPYEVQLGVLRWIRLLLSDVVDAALSSEDPQQKGNASEDGSADRDSLPQQSTAARAGMIAAADVDNPGEEAVGGEGSLEDNSSTLRESSVAPSVNSAPSNSAVPESSGEAEGDCLGGGSSRKRPRSQSPRSRSMYAVGSVVECFHPEDGLWYPASISAVIPPPTPPPATESPTQPTLTPAEGAEDPVAGSDKEKAASSSEVKLSETVPDSANAEEEVRAQELLEVTFLGYGNQSRVSREWVREIVTPEVLQWCRDNGIAEEDLAATSPTDVEQSATDEPGEPADAEADDKAVQPVPVQSKGQDPVPSEGQDPVESEGQDGKAEKGGGIGGKQGKQGGKGGGKNNKKKKNKKNNKATAAGKRTPGSGKEEEERFLMRCASRTKSPYPHVPNKYWGQRYRYFSRYDDGVSMDQEGWYSVTPEAIALHVAERVCCDVVVDPFVGCGGNAVQFALVCHVVFAIDIDPLKLEHARRNAAIYGVENHIEFILGDAMKVLPTLKADAVFLSPPWGGPQYQASDTFDLHSMIPAPLSAVDMFRAARKVTPNVVFFLPRNVDFAQVAGLPAAAVETDAGAKETDCEGGEEGAVVTASERCELEKQFLNGKFKTTTAYFGEDLVVPREAGKAAEGGANARQTGALLANPSPDAVAAADGSTATTSSSGAAGVGYYDGTARIPPWSGRHVRFSDNDCANDEAVARGVGGANGEQGEEGEEEKPCSASRARENALYEAWMAVASGFSESVSVAVEPGD